MYRITYQPMQKLQHLEKRRSRRAALAGLFLFCFLLFTCLFWPAGRKCLQSFLIPGDAAVTVAAMEELSLSLKSGIPLYEGFADFCHSILEGAGIAPG